MVKTYIGIAAFLAAFFFGYQWAAVNYKLTITQIELQAESDAKAAVMQSRAKEHRLQAITDKYNDLLSKPNVIYETITKEVIQYVESDSADKCLLSSSWVQLHDRAARPDITESADRANAASSTVKDDIALMVIAENYEQCNVYRQRLTAWQNWWREIKDAY